jgi:hypothetical protein
VARTCLFRGTPEDLRRITEWCETLYQVTFGKTEGAERFKRLRFSDALDLYRAGDGTPFHDGETK